MPLEAMPAHLNGRGEVAISMARNATVAVASSGTHLSSCVEEEVKAEEEEQEGNGELQGLISTRSGNRRS